MEKYPYSCQIKHIQPDPYEMYIVVAPFKLKDYIDLHQLSIWLITFNFSRVISACDHS